MNNLEKMKKQVIKALKQLEIEVDDVKLEITEIELNTYKININNEYFGLFDANRNTFVD